MATANQKDYYEAPIYSDVSLVKSEWVHKNKIETSGLFDCPVGNVMAVNKSEKIKFRKYNDEYRNILTPSELIDYDKEPKITPKTNSKEYKAMVEYLTQLVRKGDMICIPPASTNKVKEYKEALAKQKEIESDPRVVAARIQASATSNAMLSAERNFMMQQMSIQAMENNMRNQYIQQANNLNLQHIIQQSQQESNQMTQRFNQMNQNMQNIYSPKTNSSNYFITPMGGSIYNFRQF